MRCGEALAHTVQGQINILNLLNELVQWEAHMRDSLNGGPLYNEKEAARIWGCSPRTLRAWRKANLMECILTPTGRVRYTLDQILSVKKEKGVTNLGPNQIPRS